MLPNLGIDQIEDGKLSSARWEQWDLQCYSVSASCSLERVVFTYAFGDDKPPFIKSWNYSTADGSLRAETDWERGRLDLSFEYPDGVREAVGIGLVCSGGSFFLTSLRGVVLHRSLPGTLLVLEHRLGPYDTKRTISLQLDGFKTAAHRAWDQLIESLSAEDQASWRAIIDDAGARPSAAALDTCWKGKVPMREPVGPEFWAAGGECSLNIFREWLRSIPLSADGRARILAYVEGLPLEDRVELVPLR
jgi:hypothetical protein